MKKVGNEVYFEEVDEVLLGDFEKALDDADGVGTFLMHMFRTMGRSSRRLAGMWDSVMQEALRLGYIGVDDALSWSHRLNRFQIEKDRHQPWTRKRRGMGEDVFPDPKDEHPPE